MPRCDFNKVAFTLRHECSPVNLLHISRTLFLGTPLGGCFWQSYLLIFYGLSSDSQFRLFQLIQFFMKHIHLHYN